MQKSFNILLIIVLFMYSCSFAQQMAMSNTSKEPGSNIYKDIENLNQKITSNPTDINLLNERANLFLKINDYEKALNDIERGLSIDPQSDKLYYSQTIIFMKRKKYDSAIESSTEAIRISGTEKNYFLRSNVYYARGDVREAILDLNQILRINPMADYAYLQKAFWCNDLNMFYEEIKNYLYYIKISTDKINVAQVKKRLKKIRSADRYYANLYSAAKKDIRKNGYPWAYKVWQ
jgi:tetratricopeptide (TPR) repeat protein